MKKTARFVEQSVLAPNNIDFSIRSNSITVSIVCRLGAMLLTFYINIDTRND